MPRERGAEAPVGAVDPRRLTYAPEYAGASGPASRLTPAPEPSILPWEELARIRRAPGVEPPRGEGSPRAHPTLTDPPPMTAASAPPVRGDAATAFLTTPVVSPTAASFGWTRTAIGGQRPAREVPAAERGRKAWKWLLAFALLALAIHQLFPG